MSIFDLFLGALGLAFLLLALLVLVERMVARAYQWCLAFQGGVL